MSLYNKTLYNNELYNASPLAPENIGLLEREDGSIVVDKWISPLYRRFFPRHFYDYLGYERFMQFYRYYLEFLEQGKNPYWVLSHLVELSSVSSTLTEALYKLREQYAPDFRFEDFPDIDARKFLENAKSFYSKKGTNLSFQYLFQMLGKDVEVIKPIDDTLFIGEHSVIGKQKLIDSFYYTPFTYDVITDLPYSEWNEFIRRLNHPIGTQMFGTFLLLLAEQMLQFPSVNTNFPNVSDSLVHVTNSIPSNGNFTLEVSGDITDFPDPDDPDSEDALIVRVGDEDMLYTDKGDNAFLITGRGLNGTKEQTAIDVSQFFIDVDNNQLVYSNRVSHYTGKPVTLSTTDTLPTPLETGTTYYVTLVEHRFEIVGNVAPTDLEITVDDASLLPTTGGKLYINGEILGYSAIVGNTLTVTRGQDSTTAVSHIDGDTGYLWTRTTRLSNTLSDALNRVYIDVTDTGQGSHTISGLGVNVSLFTGFAVVRPQAITVRELNAYTSYNDVNRHFFADTLLKVNYTSTVTATPASTNLDIVSAATNPFSKGERVYFTTISSSLTSDIDSSVTTIPVEDTTDFDASGFVKIGKEFIQYTGKTGVSLTGATRGAMGSTATSHYSGETIRPRMFTDSNGELDGVYYVNRGPGALQFQLVELDDDDNITSTYTIQDDSSGEVTVNLYDIDRSELFNDPSAELTQSGGAVASIVDISGKDLVLDVSAGSFSDTTTTISDGVISGDFNGNIFQSLGSYQLWEYDFDSLTFDQLENGGDAFAQELNVRFPIVRKESNVDIQGRYIAMTMIDEVGATNDWQPDTSTPIGSWSSGTVGHIFNDAVATERGIVRGYFDTYTPIVEIYPGDEPDFIGVSIDSGLVAAQQGVELVQGDFSALSFDPDQGKYCIDLDGRPYNVVALDNPAEIEVSPNPILSGYPVNSWLTRRSQFRPNFASGVVGGDYSGRQCLVSYFYALNVGPKKEIIKISMDSDVSSSENWIPTTDTVFSATSKGHVTQLVSGATGFIRTKNVVSSKLSSDISDISTTIPLTDTSQFPSSGRIIIDTEFIVYTGKTASELTGLTRGANNTNAILHVANSTVYSANSDSDPNTVYIEVASGTFTTSPTDTISVGNGTTSSNDARVPVSKSDVSKNDPKVGDYFYVTDVDDTDENKYRTYKVTHVVNINDDAYIGFEEEFSVPVSTIGKVNWINLD